MIVWAKNEGDPERSVKVAKVKDWGRMGCPGIVRMTFDPRHVIWTCAE